MHVLNASSWLAGFLDDGSVFPPSSAPLDRAVTDFRTHQRAGYSALVGALVVPDVKVADLIDVLDGLEDDGSGEEPLPITLLVTGGAGAIEPAVRWASRSPLVALDRLELALRNEEDLVHNARRFVAAVQACEEDLSEIPTFVQLPAHDGQLQHGWLAALDEVAAADLGVRLRADAGAEAVASTVDAALDRELPMRCSGTSSAITADDDLGFLNLLRAVRGCLDGDDVPGLLRETSVEALLAGQDADSLARARRWLDGVSTPDLFEAHDGLIDAGLLPA